MGQCAHLRNYARRTDCRVVAIAEPRAKLARTVADHYAIGRTYSNAQDMMVNEQIDALVAIQPFDHHGSVVTPLFQHGLPILTEKPLASSYPTGQALVKAMQAGSSRHWLGYHKRSDPATIAAKAEIDRLKDIRELGHLRYVRVTMPEGDWIAGGFAELITTDDPQVPVDADPVDPHFNAADNAEYVRFANYYIHQVNLVRHLLGEPYRLTHVDEAGIVILGRSQSGVSVTIEMSPYRTSVGWHESVLVAFERGTIRLDLPAPLTVNRAGSVTFFRDRGAGSTETLTPEMAWVSAMQNQAANFIAAVRGEPTPLCDATEALEDLDIVRQYIELRKR